MALLPSMFLVAIIFKSGSYASLQGTSIACTHVSGTSVSLYAAINGKLPMYALNGAPSAQTILLDTAMLTSTGIKRLNLAAAITPSATYAVYKLIILFFIGLKLAMGEN